MLYKYAPLIMHLDSIINPSILAPPPILHEPIAEEYQEEGEIMEGSLGEGYTEQGVRQGQFWGNDGYPDQPEIYEQEEGGQYYDEQEQYEQANNEQYANQQQEQYSNERQPQYANEQYRQYGNERQPQYANEQHPQYGNERQPPIANGRQLHYANETQPQYANHQQQYEIQMQQQYANEQHQQQGTPLRTHPYRDIPHDLPQNRPQHSAYRDQPPTVQPQDPPTNTRQRPSNMPYDNRQKQPSVVNYPASGTEPDSAFHSSPCDGSNDYPQSPYTDQYGYTPSPHAGDELIDDDSSGESEAAIEHDLDGGVTHRLSYVADQPASHPMDPAVEQKAMPHGRSITSAGTSHTARPLPHTVDKQSNMSRQISRDTVASHGVASRGTGRQDVAMQPGAMRSVSQSSLRSTQSAAKPPLPYADHHSGSSRDLRQEQMPGSKRTSAIMQSQQSSQPSEQAQPQYNQPKSLAAPVSHTRWNLHDLANHVPVHAHSSNQVPVHAHSTNDDDTSTRLTNQQAVSSKPSSAKQGNTYVEGVHIRPKPLKPLLRGSIAGAYESAFPEESVGFIDATLGTYTQHDNRHLLTVIRSH